MSTSDRPLFLGATRLYTIEQTRMKDYPVTAQDVEKIRLDFLNRRPPNLEFLVRKRYTWMNQFIKPDQHGVEVGCGTGLSKEYIHSPNFKLTDYFLNPWVDLKVDALKQPFEDSSLDYIVSSNMIHHLASPKVFFDECFRVLKPGGLLIIQEINCSLAMRAILRIMRHEGYSYEVDVFDPKAICNDPKDPWSANCAIPNMLFDNQKKFEKAFPFQFVHSRPTEFLIFPISGGQNSKMRTIQLPHFLLRLMDLLDNILIFLAPKIFPLQRQIVLKSKKS